MAKGLQINQVGDAFKTAPGFSYKEASQMGSDVAVNSSSWFAIQPVTGTHTVEIPVAGRFRAELAVHPLPTVSIGTYQFRIIFNEGESNEVVAGDDLSWAFRSNNLGQYHFLEFVDYIDLPAGTHTYKVQATRIDGSGTITMYNNAISRPPIVTLQAISGSGTGGIISAQDEFTGGTLDASTYNELVNDTWLTIFSKTITTGEGEDVFISSIVRVRKTTTTTTQPKSSLWIDGVKLYALDDQIANQWNYSTLSIAHLAKGLSAGEHTIEIKLSSYTNTNGDYQYWCRYPSIIQYRGGHFPIQRDGVDQVIAPSALNIVGPLEVIPSGTAAVMRMPTPTFSGLYDAPSQYAGSGDYFVKVKATEDGVEFVAPSGGGASPTTFTDLADTPGSLGDAFDFVRVNSAGDALEFVAPSGVQANGIIHNVAWNTSSVNLTTNDTWVDITGSSLTIDTLANEDVLVLVRGLAYPVSAADAYFEVGIKVDSETDPRIVQRWKLEDGNSNKSTAFSAVVEGLSAGSHTIKLQGRKIFNSSDTTLAGGVPNGQHIEIVQYRGGEPDVALTELNDGPTSYAGAGHHIVRVKDTLDGFEFVAPSGTPGTTEFTGLTDTPSIYSGSEHYNVRVNQAGDGLEFVAPSGVLSDAQGVSIDSVTLDSSFTVTQQGATMEEVDGMAINGIQVNEGERLLLTYTGQSYRNDTTDLTRILNVAYNTGGADTYVKLPTTTNGCSAVYGDWGRDAGFSVPTPALPAGTYNFKLMASRSNHAASWDLTSKGIFAVYRFRGGGHSVTVSGLVDTPNSYDGAGHYLLRVNQAEDGVEFVAPSGTPGVTTFAGLTDTPNSYTGQAGKTPVVNHSEDGLMFVAASSVSSMADTGLPILQYSTADSNRQINILPCPGDASAPSVRRTLPDGVQRSFSTSLTCTLNGSGEGGIDTGSFATNTYYFYYLIPKASDDTQLAVVASVNSPVTGPTGYDTWEYIGHVYTGASAIFQFDQVGSWFWIRRTADWRRIFNYSAASPTVGSWLSYDLDSNDKIPQDVCGNFMIQLNTDMDNQPVELAVVTNDGTPAYTPGGWAQADHFHSDQSGGRNSSRGIFPNIDGNIYWYFTQRGGVIDGEMSVLSVQDKYVEANMMRQSPSSTSFMGLTDTPVTYSGYAGSLLVVNGEEDGVGFIQASGIQTTSDISFMAETATAVSYQSWDTLFSEDIYSPSQEDVTLYISGAIRGATTSWTSVYFRVLVDDVKVWPPASTGLDQTIFQAMAGHNGYTLSPGTHAVVLEDLAAGSHNIKVEFQNFSGAGHNQYRNMYFQLVQHHTLGIAAKEFKNLVDTPAAYAGSEHSLVRVNLDGDALEFVAPSGTHTTLTSLEDTPSSFSGAGHYIARVNQAENALEFVVPSGADKAFLDLTDTPSGYTDDAFKMVRVNAAGDGLEFVVPSGLESGGTILNGVTDSAIAITAGAGATTVLSREVTVLGPEDTISVDFTGSSKTEASNTQATLTTYLYINDVAYTVHAQKPVYAASTLRHNISFSRNVKPSDFGITTPGTYTVEIKCGGTYVDWTIDTCSLDVMVYRGGEQDVTVSGLSDTPSSYDGAGHYLLRVKDTLDGVEFVAPSGTHTTLLSLTDTPSDYTGYGASLVRVNTAETGLEFAPTTVASGVQVTSTTLAASFTTSSDHTVYQDVDNGGGDALSVTFDAVAGETVKFLAKGIWREADVNDAAILRGQLVLDGSALDESVQAFHVGPANNVADFFQLEHYETISTTGSHTVKVQIKSNNVAVQLDSSASEPAILRVIQYRNVKPGTALGTEKTASFNLLAGTINRIDISSGNVTGTLPNAADVAGQIIKVLITDSDPSYEATITDGGSFTEYLQAAGHCSEFYSDGTNYYWLKKGSVYVSAGSKATSDFDNTDFPWPGDTNWAGPVDITSKIPQAAYGKPLDLYVSIGTTQSLQLSEYGDVTSGQQNIGYTYQFPASMMVPSTSTGGMYYRMSGSFSSHKITVRGWWVDV